ncbi:MAG: ABC transporter ATP-binding protein [Rikenellaceae bacterium]
MIKCTDIHKSYGDLEVLKGVSLEIKPCEVVSIIGPSGAGKSTLLHILGTLGTADQGSVEIAGRDLKSMSSNELASFRNKHIGFVFQFHHLLTEFSALENVLIPAMIAGGDIKSSEKKAVEILKILGVDHRKTHKPAELSGGEAQRVAIARALMNSPEVLFADEPSGNLDSRTREELHKTFFDLRDELGLTVVLVTHDNSLAGMSDRQIEIIDGKIVK